jgi:hypothetical protein
MTRWAPSFVFGNTRSRRENETQSVLLVGLTVIDRIPFTELPRRLRALRGKHQFVSGDCHPADDDLIR